MLFGTGASSARSDVGSGRQEELSGLVNQENRKVKAYDKQVEQLQRDVDRASRTRARDDKVTAEAQRRSDDLGKTVGLEPVTGETVRISLDDAPRSRSRDPGSVPPDYLVVHQQDVQAVVNAMWVGGASAVQVMDQRLISTSAVRCVGNTLLLGGKVYSPPFTVTAVGDTDKLLAALGREPGVRLYKQYVDTYGLVYKVERLGTTTIPGYEGTLDLKHANGPSS
ncbi:MAG: DUF881 domain-containing protein [Streptosporangiales bacterium]|nr:DUF881 domain-containing protein [Streptosporangiales bacterium]